MTSHTRAMRRLPLCSIMSAMLWFAGAMHAQNLHGEALAKALQKGGYVLVIRHASSPREVPDKQTANTDNTKLERQLDKSGRESAIAMGKALRDLRIPIGNVLSSPTYRALETVRLAQFGEEESREMLGTLGYCARQLDLRAIKKFGLQTTEPEFKESTNVPSPDGAA